MLQAGILSSMVFIQSMSCGNDAYPYTHFQISANHTCVCDSIAHPAWKNHSVYLYRPDTPAERFPVIFFCHGITAENPELYGGLIRHMVGRGYAVVFAPYPSSKAYLMPRCTYQTMWRGFKKGVDEWGALFNLDSIGFVGHSYGAGAVPSLAYKAVTGNRWGRESVFLYIMAPWYVHGISQRQMQQYPAQVKMVVEVFADDAVNDHRIAKDIYLSTGIPDSAKVFCTFRTLPGTFGSSADHDVPLGRSDASIDVDDGDFAGVYFVFDALASYTNNPVAGDARFRHENMMYALEGPSGKTCIITTERKPVMRRTQVVCANFWRHCMNPRRRLYRCASEPVRLLFGTPETILHYGLLGCTILTGAGAGE